MSRFEMGEQVFLKIAKKLPSESEPDSLFEKESS
jgi:hypothetical protein